MENAFGQSGSEKQSLISLDMTWSNTGDLNSFTSSVSEFVSRDLHRLQLIWKIIVCESLVLTSSSLSQSSTPCVSFTVPETWCNLGARHTEITADFFYQENVLKRAATPQQDNQSLSPPLRLAVMSLWSWVNIMSLSNYNKSATFIGGCNESLMLASKRLAWLAESLRPRHNQYVIQFVEAFFNPSFYSFRS